MPLIAPKRRRDSCTTECVDALFHSLDQIHVAYGYDVVFALVDAEAECLIRFLVQILSVKPTKLELVR